MSALLCFAAACNDKEEKTCLGSSTKCGDTCVEVASDQLNCGACGNACSGSQVCTAGACVESACGNSCAANQSCQNNVCVDVCTAPLAACGNTCADIVNDPNNCGACGAACAPGVLCLQGTCGGDLWEDVALYPMGSNTGSMTTNNPAGESSFYLLQSGNFYRYDAPPVDAYTPLADPIDGISGYIGAARIGASLYAVTNKSLYVYSIADNTWTQPIVETLTVNFEDSQTAADDSGFVYAASQAGRKLVQINATTSEAVYFDLPENVGDDEPRVLWDTTAKRLIVADYDDNDRLISSFDPANTAAGFTALTPAPESQVGYSDAFCGDNRGHIFTGSAECDNRVFAYTIATGTWQQLPDAPHELGCSQACTVTGDGWLYIGEADDSGYVARRRVFAP